MKGFVKKRTTRVVGIIAVLMIALVIGVVTAVATSKASTAQAVQTPKSVAIFDGPGTNPAETAATFRAVQACGFRLTASAWTTSPRAA